MHTPSLITPLVAAEVLGDHTREARTRQAQREARGGGLRRRLRAPRPLVPRGRTPSPLAH